MSIDVKQPLKCSIHGEAIREYIVCVHVRRGQAIAYFEDATERTPGKDGATGYMLCSSCEIRTRANRAENESVEPVCEDLLLICGNRADQVMAEQDFVK
jgi:hypothetical protein